MLIKTQINSFCKKIKYYVRFKFLIYLFSTNFPSANEVILGMVTQLLRIVEKEDEYEMSLLLLLLITLSRNEEEVNCNTDERILLFILGYPWYVGIFHIKKTKRFIEVSITLCTNMHLNKILKYFCRNFPLSELESKIILSCLRIK